MPIYTGDEVLTPRSAASAEVANAAIADWAVRVDRGLPLVGDSHPAQLNMEDDDMSEVRYTRTLLAAGTFTAALAAVPSEDWSRTWAAGRTIMLRVTSKRVKEAVDKMRLPAVVRLSRRFFWDDSRNSTAAEKLQFVMRQLPLMTARCSITTLELLCCYLKGRETLAGVLAQCPALAHLDLSSNLYFEAAGAERLAVAGTVPGAGAPQSQSQ